jgi:hypothetical protein
MGIMSIGIYSFPWKANIKCQQVCIATGEEKEKKCTG